MRLNTTHVILPAPISHLHRPPFTVLRKLTTPFTSLIPHPASLVLESQQQSSGCQAASSVTARWGGSSVLTN